MPEIKLPCGAIATVDENSYEELMRHAWKLDRYGYAVRLGPRRGGQRKTIAMHRVVSSARDGEYVDHVNGDVLDNRLENLRIATLSQNSANRKKTTNKSTSSQYKGVTWNKSSNKWQAQIMAEKKQEYIGLFECEHEAGHAYNKAAIRLHGDFARLNPVGLPKLPAQGHDKGGE